MGNNGIDDYKKCRHINNNFDCHNVGASPNGVHPWLHAKPLDVTIEQVPAPYCLGSRHC